MLGSSLISATPPLSSCHLGDWHTVLQARDLATWAKEAMVAGIPRIRDRERFFHWS